MAGRNGDKVRQYKCEITSFVCLSLRNDSPDGLYLAILMFDHYIYVHVQLFTSRNMTILQSTSYFSFSFFRFNFHIFIEFSQRNRTT